MVLNHMKSATSSVPWPCFAESCPAKAKASQTLVFVRHSLFTLLSPFLPDPWPFVDLQ